jgi:hypothetical protein
MRRKFKLKNSLEQHIAVVLYFFEEQIQITLELSLPMTYQIK